MSHQTEGVLALTRRGQQESGEDMIILSVEQLCSCKCEIGETFREENSTDLQRLENQLRSFPRPIRRELLEWFIDKHTNGTELIIQKENDVPACFGSELCSNEILTVHREYGEMAYSAEMLGSPCGCPCHGF